MTAARALGLDVGQKTIGVALTDAAGIAAHPHSVIARAGMKSDVSQLITLARENDVSDIVVGLPLEMSGKVGLRASRVRKLISALAEALSAWSADDEPPQIHEWDERFSTVGAERVLLEADLSRKRRKQVIDKQAAAYILAGWLELRASKRPEGEDQADDDADEQE